VLADFLAARLPKPRDDISLVIAVRALVGMVIFTFLTQEVLGMGRALAVPEKQVTATISELFLNGLSGCAPGEAAS